MALFKDEDLHEKLEALDKRLDRLEGFQNGMAGQLKDVDTDIKSLILMFNKAEEEKTAASQKVHEEISKVAETNESFERSVRSFKDLQHKVQLHTFDKVNEGINRSTDELKRDIQKYSDAKKDINSFILSLEEVKKELTRFRELSGQIRNADFQLKEYAKTLSRNDQEKLNLMKQIDQLQKIVASMRRTGRH